MSKNPFDDDSGANAKATELEPEENGEGLPGAGPETLRLIPFGGCGEIGMNCHAVEYEDQILLIDCGQMFPDEEMLGVDYVIPDLQYVIRRSDRVQAILLTHAHEDHVGALPYVLPQFPGVPVYGAELTIAMMKEKLREHHLDRTTNWQVYEPRQRIELGVFTVEPLAVTHSIIDAVALAIETPGGVVIHSGDYKIDPSPPDGLLFDHYALSRYGEQGVLVLAADSTNVDRPGASPSERSVIPALDRLIREAPRQVILATFASSLHRIQTVLNLAAKHGRTVLVTGLNMERNIRIAVEIGAIEIPCRFVDDIRSLSDTPPEKRLILTTGSQGEPLSALSRMALDDHRHVKVEPDDTVILSSRIIPGNERSIYRMINHFAKRGAHIFHENNSQVHVSGHAYSDDMRSLINLVNPRYVMPIHGEYRHLAAHRDLAVGMGFSPEEVFVVEDGQPLELRDGEAKIGEAIPCGRVLVDGKGVGDVGDVVLRDRFHLSQDGTVVVVVAVDRQSGEIVAGPDILARGFIYEDAGSEIITRARAIAIEAFEGCERESREEWEVVKTAIKRALKKYFKQETARFPVILPVVLEI
jgi:ribonuclease J